MKSPLTVIGGVVTVLFLLVALILGLSVTSGGLTAEAKQLLIVSVLALVGSTIPSLLSLYKAEGAQQSGKAAEQTAHDVHEELMNGGSIVNGVKQALTDLEQDPNHSPIVHRIQGTISSQTESRKDKPNG